MTAFEQMARALKEIAAELKGIRKVLQDIDKKIDRRDGYRADVAIVDELAGRESDLADNSETFFCEWTGGECDGKHPGICSDPCDFRKKGGADNG